MKNNKPSLSSKQYIVPFVLITSLFFMWGFARAILDVLNKHFQNELDITITQSALIQVTTYLGYFLMAIPSGLFINRFGYRRGVVFGLLLFGLGSLLFIPCAAAGTFYAFLAALFVIGCGLTFLETAANPYATELGPKETATSRLNFSQSFNGLGCMFATFGVGQFLFNSTGGSEGGNVAVPYAIMGVLVLVIAVVFSRVNLPEIKHADDADAQAPASGAHNLRLLFANRMFLFGLAALLAYEVAEISINSYFINFVTGMGWMADKAAAMVIKGVSLVALIANYLFEAIMFPTIFSLTLNGLGSLTKSASSILMMTPVGGCGFLLMGLIADRTDNFILPFFIPLVGFAIVLAYAMKKRAGMGNS